MKHIFKSAALLFAAAAFFMTGCNNKSNKDIDVAPYIISLTINNGGLTGTERYTGTVDTAAHTVVFNNVAAETNLAAVKFESKLSIGSTLDKTEYDFLTGAEADAKTVSQTISVVPEFGNNVTYTVTLNLKDPETAPVIDRLVIKDAAGAEHTVTAANVVENLLLLGVPESATAEVVSVALLPARATYEFTAIADNVISATNPGMLKLNFMGLTTEYQLSFSSTPAAGADFSKAVVHAWDNSTSVYTDLADQNTRSGDIDENYILLVNRAGDVPNPYLLRIDDVLAGNVGNKVQLDITGVEGGTFAVSSGRLTQGHIYICNLQSPAVGEEAPLIIYHWESATAKPVKVLEWTGALDNAEDPFNLRLGDNLAISLDASGNGYAFLAGQETGTERLIRFTVTGFTQFSEPTALQLKAPAQYYGIYNKVGDNEYLFKSTFNPTLWLYDKDATLLYELAWEGSADGGHATDFHIVEFNRARYLICTNARRYNWWKPEALLVYDITEGMTNAAALKAMDENRPIDPESEDPEFPDYLPFEPVFKYEYSSGENPVAACSAICNAVVKDGKLVILSAAPTAGLVVVEVPIAL